VIIATQSQAFDGRLRSDVDFHLWSICEVFALFREASIPRLPGREDFLEAPDFLDPDLPRREAFDFLEALDFRDLPRRELFDFLDLVRDLPRRITFGF